ncbi:hypothetical protein O0I10_002041 [Lichtheimia ornata]|uniref:3'-5' exonuclease domain-containing protein n=1 Tax=Lichtheimia ornata TaxID=688661 RepID=A0AAD7Y2T8_9FUNG|nr:uncharacterized protein O0I10_002041 [Lichtheimia ornata]KAJ8662347.1 hypothetical protein O0I10_002041 [Lichtheimia ornata]
MSGNDSDSSDDDWVITSTATDLPTSVTTSPSPPSQPPQQRTLPQSTPKKPLQRPTVSQATVRTIRASLSKNQLAGDPHKTRSAAEINYISQEQLESICSSMDSHLLVRRLVETYKNAETFLRIKDIETAKMTFDARLSETLYLCSDPGCFILDFIRALDSYFSQRRDRDLTPKFRRYLVQAACQAYQTFLDTPPNEYKVPNKNHTKAKATTVTLKQPEEIDLISFPDDDEPNLISFDDDDNSTSPPPPPLSLNSNNDLDVTITEILSSNDEEEDDSSNDEDEDDIENGMAKVTFADLMDIPAETLDRYRLKYAHQESCIHLLDVISSPILIYYAMGVFKLHSLMAHGCDYEEEGVRLCRMLMQHKHYNEAISCIRRLDLFHAFPVEQMAGDMISNGMSNMMPVYVSGHEALQRQLLDYINRQLRYTFAGSLGIVPEEHLKDLESDLQRVPPLPRLKERRFQKDLTSCCGKIMQELNEEPTAYYFIWLSQRYACLRWIIMERAAQQSAENDYSVSSSSNYNGLIDLVTADDPALAKLAIKEFVDIGDPVAPTYFAGRLKQQQFFVQYYQRPLQDRAVGIFKGEQLSQPRPIPSRHAMTNDDQLYQLPAHARPVMVDNQQDLLYMKATLAKTRVCGLDTEWVPQFARQEKLQTAVMQIASDTGFVFLVDLATLLQPTHVVLLQDLDLILRMLFEADHIVKLGKYMGVPFSFHMLMEFHIAYDFGGDFNLLGQCMPSVKKWSTKHLVDFKNLRTADDKPITGGLSGTVKHFLGVSMNKKQQLSNWEQRPLTVDQATYAGKDDDSSSKVIASDTQKDFSI